MQVELALREKKISVKQAKAQAEQGLCDSS